MSGLEEDVPPYVYIVLSIGTSHSLFLVTFSSISKLVSLTFLVNRLESKLRSFACLTKGDIIGIEYNNKV